MRMKNGTYHMALIAVKIGSKSAMRIVPVFDAKTARMHGYVVDMSALCRDIRYQPMPARAARPWAHGRRCPRSRTSSRHWTPIQGSPSNSVSSTALVCAAGC